MAQYKVPQDVEADDKLLGPFNFRQFVYLLIAGGLIAAAVGLFQVFPILGIIPIPFALFLLALALPLKKDQPMETYLSALLSFYTKPHTRTWQDGQPDKTIRILAPLKNEEESLARNITGEEATNRLSFLANLVDSKGMMIKNGGNNNVVENSISQEIKEEAEVATDIYETTRFENLGDTIMQDEIDRHRDVIREMQEAIKKSTEGSIIKHTNTDTATNLNVKSEEDAKKEVVVPTVEKPVEKSEEKVVEKPQKSSIIELANNPELSVATIAKEANRINNKKKEGEVFISLH